MESQIQIQSEAMEIVIPSGNGGGGGGANSNVVDRSRQQRQQTSPVTTTNVGVGRCGGNGVQQKHQQQQKNQASNVPRVLIVSPSVQHHAGGPNVTTRSASDRKPIIITTQQSQQHPSQQQLHHQTMASRQIVIHQQPSASPKSNNHGSHHVLGNGNGNGNGQQQVATTATVQNGQLVITNLTENRGGRHQPPPPQQQQQQQQLHRQQQILIIQQPERRRIEEDDDNKDDDLQSQEQVLPMGVAQTITVAVSDQEGRGDGASTAIYPTLQPGTYTVYPGDAGGYSPQGHHYYTGQVSYQTPLHSPASTYIIQSSGGGGLQHSPLGGGGPCNPIVGVHEDEAAAQQLSHTTRASPATIQWLLQNYETAEGVSLPRCTLYNHYLKHCSEHKLDPVNAASFGKLIRSVFLGLRTRRLGTRGNSKYHYYGIRIKPESPLNRISDESMATMAMRQQPTSQTRRPRPMVSSPPPTPLQSQSNIGGVGGLSSGGGASHGQQPSLGNASASAASIQHQSQSGANADTGSASGTPNSIHSNNAAAANLPVSSSNQQHSISAIGDGNKQYVGDGLVPDVMPPPLEHLESSFERLGLSMEDAARFFTAYRTHCEDVLDCVKNLLFSDVERCWRAFWQPDDLQRNRDSSSLDEDVESDLDDDDSMSGHNLTGLNRMQLYSLCALPLVQEFVQTMDFQFYQVVVDVLIPNVLKPIPSTLTQSIRNFAKRLENGLGLALQGAPDVIVRIKLDAVGSLAQTLRRYTSLNHLAQAARAVLQNAAQIQQMLTDLNRVDFHNVQEQASWVCDCDPSVVDQIEKDFKSALERQKTLEQWGSWLETVVDQVLGGYDVLNVVNGRQEHDASVVRLTTVARQFLLKWSFYSSMVMRDLTLRSAPSFGSFHLIRLLYDEYMFYLVEQRVARLTGQTTIAVMSQSYRNHIASLASGEHEYHAYQLQQQQLHEQQQLSHGQQQQQQQSTSKSDLQHRRHQDDVLSNADVYPSSAAVVDSSTRHHFAHQQIINSEANSDGDASLAGMDRASSGAVVVMNASGDSEVVDVAGVSNVVTLPAGVSASYVLHHHDPNDNNDDEHRQHVEEAEETNVVDEYFITTTIHQDGNKRSRLAEAKAAVVLPTMANDWEQHDQQQMDKDDDDDEHRNAEKPDDISESSTPMKKRRHSLKFNGDTNSD